MDTKYPLFGKVKLTPDISLPDALSKINGTYGVVVANSLLKRLDRKMGDKIRIGNNLFEIRALLVKEPDLGSNTFSFAPRVLAYNVGLIESGLLGSGTMFDTDYRLALPKSQMEETKRNGETLFKENGIRWRDSNDATPGLDRFVDQLTSFLLLIGMAGLAVGGIGVALSVTVYLEMKRSTIAILKTIGASNLTIFSIYFLIILILAIAGSTLGALAGAMIPMVLEPFIGQRFPIPIIFGFYYQPILNAIFYGVLTAILFSTWPLGRMLNNTIANLFRDFINQTKETPNLWYKIWTLVILLFFVLSFSLRSPDPIISLSVFFGIAVSLLGLLVMAKFIKVLCTTLSKRKILKKNLKMHLALSSLGGPNNEIALTMLSIGLGLIVLATIGQIDNNLRKNITYDLSSRSPTFFLIDVQPSQLNPLRDLMLKTGKVTGFSSAPMLRGIINKINGLPAREVAGDHWAIRGDRGLTYSDLPPENNAVVSGEWWKANYVGAPLISFAREEAREMGLSIGDKITVNVLGRDLVGTIVNFRDVDFATMSINFLMVFNSNALDTAPHSHIATIYSDMQDEGELQRIIGKNFPNVTAISMQDTLSQVTETVTTITAITRWGSLITVIIGFVVLVGVALATEKKRSYEACLLKTLGASRNQILTSFTLRSLIVGVGAGLMAVVVSSVSSWAIISVFFDSNFRFGLANALIIVFAGVTANVTASLAFARKPLTRSVSQTLRYNE